MTLIIPTEITRRRLIAGATAFAAVLMLPRRLFAQGAPEIAEMSMGDADAPVTVVEYASLTCPHCAAFHTEVLPRIRENFVDTGKVRVVYREVFFDGPSVWAAMMARCAGPDRYFGVIDLLYRTQAEWLSSPDPAEITRALYSVGRQAGLTDAEMQACMTDAEFAEALVAEFQKNAAADGIEATPTFIIDGEKAQNMPYEEFEARLNQALGS